VILSIKCKRFYPFGLGCRLILPGQLETSLKTIDKPGDIDYLRYYVKTQKKGKIALAPEKKGL